MKYEIVSSTKFKRDLKLAIKRGYDMSLMNEVIEILANGNVLPERFHDHALNGNQ